MRGRFLEAILSADGAKAGRTGAPERSTARWLVERWEALRLALGAHGALPCEVGPLIRLQGVPNATPLAPPTAPHPRAGRAREIANLGRLASRERGSVSRHSRALAPSRKRTRNPDVWFGGS